jgi:hypothetical protein
VNVRVLLIVVAMSFAACRAPEKPRETQPDVPLAKITYGAYAHTDDQSVESEKEYTFTFGGELFKLERTGRFTCGTHGSTQLDLDELPFVDSLQYVSYGKDVLLLLYELSDGEGGLARISRVYLPTCELVFSSDLPGFNLGPAALEGSTLYVTTIGFVGRFDVESWGFDWTHGNLYERHKFNAFLKPEVYRDRVVFPESTSSSRDAPRNVVVDKSSGAMTIAQRAVSR